MTEALPHASIRPMRREDAKVVALLHANRMPRSLLGRLGPGFLKALYRTMCADPSFLGLVAEDGAGLAGYIATTSDPHGFMGRVFRAGLSGLAPRLILRSLLSPGLLLEALRLRLSPPVVETGEPNAAELLSIAAARSRSGVGRLLVEEACTRLQSTGSSSFLVLVEEGIAAHEFYSAVGFAPCSKHVLHGAPMIVYRRQLHRGPS